MLMRVADPQARARYAREAEAQTWSNAALDRLNELVAPSHQPTGAGGQGTAPQGRAGRLSVSGRSVAATIDLGRTGGR